jgi:hypothetical protein
MVGFPSSEVARAVEASKDFLDWMVEAKIQDFDTAWNTCIDVNAMFKVLLTLNPQFKNLHWVAFRAARRAAEGVQMDLDEQLLEHLKRKLGALEANNDDYDGESAIDRAVALNRIMRDRNDGELTKAKAQAQLAIGWACCKSARSCGMALDCALRSERFRIGLTEGPHTAYEPTYQVKDIQQFFPLPLTISKVRYLSRYERKWVI